MPSGMRGELYRRVETRPLAELRVVREDSGGLPLLEVDSPACAVDNNSLIVPGRS
jgi:hypothetical protein